MANTSEIEIRLLHALRALVAQRSITRAAERLNMSQPAMSHTLSRLRRIFNDPILTRSQGGLVPTARALEADEVASEILGGVARLTAPPPVFEPLTSETTFVLTATEYIEYVLVSSLLAELRIQAPHIRLEIRPPDRSLVMGWLERREVDLRLGWVYKPDPVLKSTTLFEEKLIVIACSDHPKIQGSLSMEQYLDSAHVNSEVAQRRTTGRTIDEVIGNLSHRLVRQVQVQSALTIPQAVAGSDLIATVPLGLAAASSEALRLQVLEPPMKLPLFRCVAYWHEAVDRDPRHGWFRRLLSRVAKRARPRA